MARIRTIKPSFFKNEDLAEVPMSSRLLFIGLWCLADCEGRLEDRPKRIKAELFPYDSIEIDQQLSRLQSAGFIFRYTVDDAEVGEMKVIQIINFSKHQRITGSEAEAKSEFPAPAMEGNTLETLWKQQGNTLDDRKGKERKGKELVNNSNNLPTIPNASKPVDFFKDFANQCWKDQAWRESVCMGFSLKNEKHLKACMAQFNLSLSTSELEGDFTVSRYKKMFRGWLSHEFKKGKDYNFPEPENFEKSSDPNYRLKKVV